MIFFRKPDLRDKRTPPSSFVEADAGRARKKPSLVQRLPLKLRLLIAVGCIGFIGLSALISSALIYYTIRFPDPMALRKSESGPVVRVLARDGSVLMERGQAHPYIPIDLLPRHIIDAVIATEDRRFFDHNGLDPSGFLRAAFANLRAGRYVQGGSTLSQQLAKNLFLSSERTLVRKIEELLIAIWLEVRLEKSEILELYLNRVYFGGGAYGIEAASHRYFAKGARNLTLSEAAIVAGLLKAPSKFSPQASPGLARQRGRVVLKSMLAAGFISPQAETSAARQSVQFSDQNQGRELTGLEYAVDFVLERLPPLVGSGHREITVETTIDAALQKRAQKSVSDALASEGAATGAGQAAAIVLDTDGGIRAMVGGGSWAQSQFNRAVKAKRQPGSAFKPFVYLTAVEQGATPDTIVLDMPVSIGNWSPRNESGQHRGAMPLRQALAHSINSVAVRLQQDAGTNRVIATARRLGIKSELRADPSLALGTSEVSLLEITGAYAVLAAGGLGIEPHAIVSVRSSSKAVLYKRSQTRPRMIIAPDHVGMMSSMLNTAMISGTGRRAALSRHVAAGKTGTSQDFRDAWFVGYTTHLTGGIWVGNDSGEPMSRVTGGGLPATIWRSIMQPAHEQLAPSTLPGMDTPRPPHLSDTLQDTDRTAKPINTIKDLLSLEGGGHAPAQAVAARPRAPTPNSTHQNQARALDRKSADGIRQEKRAPALRSAPMLDAAKHPKAPIDPDLIARAIGSHHPRNETAASVQLTAPIPARRRLPFAKPELMGIGLSPPPAPAVDTGLGAQRSSP